MLCVGVDWPKPSHTDTEVMISKSKISMWRASVIQSQTDTFFENDKTTHFIPRLILFVRLKNWKLLKIQFYKEKQLEPWNVKW